VKQTRVDLLGETADRKRIIGLELQSVNDGLMPLRMAEYAMRVYRVHKRFPEQYVLYVGNARMRMASELKGKDFHCKYKLVDIRSVDGEALLASPFDSDGIIAVLAR
jgi:hypothetical protein